MTKRIFRTVFAVAISVLLASVILFMGVLYDYFTGVQYRQLKMQTDLAARGVVSDGIEYFDGLDVKNYRITWIGTDGGVLYDSASDADEMENHFAREEVKEALAEGYGESSRYSATMTECYLYSAKRLTDGTVIRLSVAQNSLWVLTLGMLQPLLVIIAAAIVLSIVLAYRLSKKIVKPLNELNLDEPLNNDGYDELAPLLRRIDKQQRQILWQKNELKRKQSEFDTVTRSMAEGIILLNQKGVILSINRAAAELFGTDSSAVGKDILSVNRSPALSELLHKSENGSRAEAVMDFGSAKYQADVSPVLSGGEAAGTVILLMDVTEKEKAEQIRREFTANVSHELKTPLHTISGCAELLAGGMVRPEDITSFSKQIYTEAQRMIRLVEDIIKLSHLDEGAVDMQRETVDLYALAENTLRSLRPEAEAADVTLSLDGDHAKLYAIPQLVSGIIFNLCDNAIKYNRENGSVKVDIRDEDDKVILSVADTGIGIPAEHQERIFERFYRVDKSHSKEIGGTGLGLSIVKHAARLHDAVIELTSELGKGTTVTVKFPKNK